MLLCLQEVIMIKQLTLCSTILMSWQRYLLSSFSAYLFMWVSGCKAAHKLENKLKYATNVVQPSKAISYELLVGCFYS